MNASEGLTRIATLVRWGGWIFAAGFAALGFAGFVNRGVAGGGFGVLIGFVALGAACVVAALALAWVIEGFAKSRQ